MYFFTVVALGRGRKKMYGWGLGVLVTKLSESSEEKSKPKQHAGLCRGVSWSILPLSARPPSIPYVHWKGNYKERKVSKTHTRKICNPAMGK